jgi:hypothetical protein
MKQLRLLAGCRTPDYTRDQPDLCAVHRVAMTKRVVPIAYGMIPMSKTAAEQGEWRRHARGTDGGRTQEPRPNPRVERAPVRGGDPLG